MRKSLSQSWIPVKDNKAVVSVAIEGFSARVLAMFVKFSGRLFSSIGVQRGEGWPVRGEGEKMARLPCFFLTTLGPGILY